MILDMNVHSISTHQKDFKLAKLFLRHQDTDLTSNTAVRHDTLNEELCQRKYVNEQVKSKIIRLK